MKKTSNKIVFFGSGPVAAKSLELLAAEFEIEAVITKPATQAQMQAIVGEAPVLVAENRATLDNLMSESSFESSLAILIDFGIIVSQKVIGYFNYGIVNSHFSLLPEWRGADPITFSLLSGQAKTGVSLMLVDEGMDTGKILTQKSLTIEPQDTSTTLTSRLIALSNELLQSYVPLYISGEVRPRSQPHPDRATYSRKLTKQDGILDFTKSAEVLEREIRAFVEWPKSRTILGGKDVVVLKAHVEKTQHTKEPGSIEVRMDEKQIAIHCGSNILCLDALKPAGKNVMPVSSYLAGYSSTLL